jgi:hypothetical protein
MKKIRKIIRVSREFFLGLCALFLMSPKKQILALGLIRRMVSGRHYLSKCGYWQSAINNLPVNSSGNLIPWMNYSFIEFLSDKLNKKMTVFEWGSGASSFFFAERCKSIISVEHNVYYYELLKNKLKDNMEIILVNDSPENYLFEDERRYDLIVVDGIHRNMCLIKAANMLTKSGCIILDDSERLGYSESISLITKF